MLERHPNLKILAVHGGGYLAAYSGRIDHSWGARSDAHGNLPNPPTSYLKKIYFDSVVFTPYQLAELVRLYGADHIIMGTDYPFDMADYDPIGHVAGVEGFDASTIAAIAGGNAKRLLGLVEAPPPSLRHPEVAAQRPSKDARPGPSPFEARFARASG